MLTEREGRNHLLGELEPLPESIIDNNGCEISVASDQWILERVSGPVKINFRFNLTLNYVLKQHLSFLIIKNSNNEAYSTFIELSLLLDKHRVENDFESDLISTFNQHMRDLKSQGTFYRFYRSVKWYIWCADNYPELGFSVEFANHLSGMKIPGNPKGEAVRRDDKEQGPLHPEFERPALIKAALADTSENLTHIQQKVAVLLCIAFGRNSANYTQLRIEDLVNVTANQHGSEDCWVLNIPRIKKRANRRHYFKEEYLDEKLAQATIKLITATNDYFKNKAGKEVFETYSKCPRPIFSRKNPNRFLQESGNLDYAFHMSSGLFSSLVSDFCKRMKFFSPLTGEILKLNTRRCRYTFATEMVRQGVSRAVLAEMLDHSDTQHVQVYFEMGEKIAEKLDKASAKKIGEILNYFQGTVVSSDKHAENGDRPDKHISYPEAHNEEIGVCGKKPLCSLDPPYSCYICPKFQPYAHADHEAVLEHLLTRRDENLEKYSNSRIAIQLDDVIFAVGKVVELTKDTRHG